MSLFNITKEIDWAVAAPLTSNSPISDNENDSDVVLSVSSHSIEEEYKLKVFTQALQMAQITTLKMENRKRQKVYSKWSKDTLKWCKQVRIELASKGFLPVDQYMKLKGVPIEIKKLTPESDTGDDIIVLAEGSIDKVIQEESEESSDNANALGHNACTHSSVNSDSEVESKWGLPGNLHQAWCCFEHHAHMEIEESSGDNNSDGIGHYAGQHMSNKIEDKEILTTSEHLEDLCHDTVLVDQDPSYHVPGSAFQLLSDQPRLWNVSEQLTEEIKKGDLNMIICTHMTAMVGLLNIYLDRNLKYFWKRASDLVVATQGCGMHCAWCIHKWVMDFLRWRDLPLY